MRSMILALCLAAPAQAQTACTGLPDALAALAARYAEAPRVSGLMANGQLAEALDFTVGHISRMENGHDPITRTTALAMLALKEGLVADG